VELCGRPPRNVSRERKKKGQISGGRPSKPLLEKAQNRVEMFVHVKNGNPGPNGKTSATGNQCPGNNAEALEEQFVRGGKESAKNGGRSGAN